MVIDIYIRLEEYAQAKQKPVWGETWQKVLPGSGLPEELAPKTTAHPEKNIEYVRVIPRVAKAKLAKWRQYSGSDNNKAMMALTILLQLYGLYVSDAADDDLSPLQVMSLWQYFRIPPRHIARCCRRSRAEYYPSHHDRTIQRLPAHYRSCHRKQQTWRNRPHGGKDFSATFPRSSEHQPFRTPQQPRLRLYSQRRKD